MPSTTEKRSAFRKLHEAGCFVIPNPWDVGSARYLQHLGFKALATTSAGFAFSRGVPDGGGVARRDAGAYRGDRRRHRPAGERRLRGRLRARARPASPRACGSASRPASLASRSRIRPATRTSRSTISTLAVARIKAARAAIDKAGGDVLLTGRAEGFLVGRPDLDETIRRLKAYAAAGADCLYAPGIRDPRADRGGGAGGRRRKPVNFLIPRRVRVHGRRSRRPRRAPHQRRRHAFARRLGRLHPRRARRSPAKAASTASRTRCRTPSSTRSSATTWRKRSP